MPNPFEKDWTKEEAPKVQEVVEQATLGVPTEQKYEGDPGMFISSNMPPVTFEVEGLPLPLIHSDFSFGIRSIKVAKVNEPPINEVPQTKARQMLNHWQQERAERARRQEEQKRDPGPTNDPTLEKEDMTRHPPAETLFMLPNGIVHNAATLETMVSAAIVIIQNKDIEDLPIYADAIRFLQRLFGGSE